MIYAFWTKKSCWACWATATTRCFKTC